MDELISEDIFTPICTSFKDFSDGDHCNCLEEDQLSLRQLRSPPSLDPGHENLSTQLTGQNNKNPSEYFPYDMVNLGGDISTYSANPCCAEDCFPSPNLYIGTPLMANILVKCDENAQQLWEI